MGFGNMNAGNMGAFNMGVGDMGVGAAGGGGGPVDGPSDPTHYDGVYLPAMSRGPR